MGHELAALHRPRAPARVVLLRFEGDLTQGEIGEQVGISQMQVSRVLRQALARLHAVAEQSTADAA